MQEDVQVARVDAPLGHLAARVDEKGRLKLPVDFQQFFAALGEKQFFITTLDGVTGRIYPIFEWRKNLELLENAMGDSEAAEDVGFIASAFGGEAEIDSQGRVLVPAALRHHLKLENAPVHLAHYRGHVRILTDELYQAKMSRSFDGLPDKLRQFERRGLR